MPTHVCPYCGFKNEEAAVRCQSCQSPNVFNEKGRTLPMKDPKGPPTESITYSAFPEPSKKDS